MLCKEKFAAVRGASGNSVAQMTDIAGLGSTNTYAGREDSPGQFRLCEIEKMYKGMNEVARALLKEAVCDIFLD